jgi:hypothetical protein
MRKYLVYSQFWSIGVYHAIDEQGARDLCAQDAGYKDEKHMNERLDKNWDLFSKDVTNDLDYENHKPDVNFSLMFK